MQSLKAEGKVVSPFPCTLFFYIFLIPKKLQIELLKSFQGHRNDHRNNYLDQPILSQYIIHFFYIVSKLHIEHILYIFVLKCILNTILMAEGKFFFPFPCTLFLHIFEI